MISDYREGCNSELASENNIDQYRWGKIHMTIDISAPGRVAFIKDSTPLIPSL